MLHAPRTLRIMLSARSNRLICGFLPAAKTLITVLVLAPTVSCWLGDSTLGPDERVAQLTLVTAFSTHGLGTLAEVGSLGFIVRRMDGSVVVADTVPVNIESRRVEYSMEVTYTPPMETFTVELVLLDSNGGVLFTGGPIEHTISDAGDPSPLEVPAVYVGPRGIVRGSVSVAGTGLDGVTVSLVSDISLSTTTAGGGAYAFLDVGVGTYSVELSDFPPEFLFGTTSSAATVESDGQVVVVDFLGTVAPPLEGDVVVFNDVNIFLNLGMDVGVGIPNNHVLVENLVSFPSGGSRGSGTRVWWDIGRGSRCEILPPPSQCTPASYSSMASEIQDAGFTIETIFSGLGTLIDIPADVKVIFLWNPTVAYTVAEINALKQFGAEGGRIIFVGEHNGFYGTWIPIENQFLVDMGSAMVNIGEAVDCDVGGGYLELPSASLRSHQITQGMSAIRVGCSSVIQPGPNDFAFLFDSTNTKVLAGVAKIDFTPLPAGAPAPSARLRAAGSGLDEEAIDGDVTGAVTADPARSIRRR